MERSANAAKAFIIKDNKVLLLKRRPNDVHAANEWDLPGGRLELNENPFEGLKREAREEASIEIDIIMPLDVHFFTRDDGQKIYLTIFLCTHASGEVILSEEHTEYKWVDIHKDLNEFPAWLNSVIQNYHKLK